MVPTAITEALEDSGEFGSVVAAPALPPVPGVASAPALVEALDTAFDSRVYELHLADGKPMPNAVHALSSSEPYRLAGYPVAQVDRYEVTCRAESTTGLSEAVAAAFDAMAASDQGFEIGDMSLEYETDPARFAAHLEVALAVPATVGDLPAAVVVPLGVKYEPSAVGCFVQSGRASFAVMIMALPADMAAAEASARAALRGLEVDNASAGIEIEESIPEDLPGGLLCWRVNISYQVIDGHPGQ